MSAAEQRGEPSAVGGQPKLGPVLIGDQLEDGWMHELHLRRSIGLRSFSSRCRGSSPSHGLGLHPGRPPADGRHGRTADRAPLGNATLLASDFVLGVGNRYTGGIDVYRAGRKYVHVDIEPTQVGRVFAPDYGVVSDAGAFLREMAVHRVPVVVEVICARPAEMSDSRESCVRTRRVRRS
jgi:hypothetical protein